MVRFDIGTVREHLHRLKWKDGLARDDIRRRWPGLPETIYNALPRDYVFRNEGEVMSYLEHLLRHGALDRLEDTGEPPQSYRPSVGDVTHSPREHGVGSGGDPGYTGGGSVQTGVGRSGTTYGDTEEKVR